MGAPWFTFEFSLIREVRQLIGMTNFVVGCLRVTIYDATIRDRMILSQISEWCNGVALI